MQASRKKFKTCKKCTSGNANIHSPIDRAKSHSPKLVGSILVSILVRDNPGRVAS
jgi:hypothetical protein